MAGTDRGAGLGHRGYTLSAGLERVQHGAVVHVATAATQPLEQAVGEAVGVDPGRLAGQQGAARIHVEAFAQRLPVQPAGVQSDITARSTLGHQARHVAPPAGQVQAVHLPEIHVLQPTRHFTQCGIASAQAR